MAGDHKEGGLIWDHQVPPQKPDQLEIEPSVSTSPVDNSTPTIRKRVKESVPEADISPTEIVASESDEEDVVRSCGHETPQKGCAICESAPPSKDLSSIPPQDRQEAKDCGHEMHKHGCSSCKAASLKNALTPSPIVGQETPATGIEGPA